MEMELVGLVPLSVAGIPNRYILAALAIVVLAALLLVVARRRGGRPIEVQLITVEAAVRYVGEMDLAEGSFVENPRQATARARGIVEEVMRRKGFPDRMDAAQRVKDLDGFDREAARSFKAATQSVQGSEQDDTESLRRALKSYREALYRLLKEEHLQGDLGGSVGSQAAAS
jgi:hypothetical protein